MLDKVSGFLVVLEEGSVSRAATRLHVSQPALTRQVQALEDEAGGALLERGPWGVRPTDLGHAFAAAMRPVVEAYRDAWETVQRKAEGRHETLRVGYIGSASGRFLVPVLAEIRDLHPDTRFQLLDLTPREQIERLRAGELDVAIVGQEGEIGDTEFFARKIARLPVCVALPLDHRLAGEASIPLSDLKGERFIGASDDEVPGRNSWTAQLCRKAGFRPRFSAQCSSIDEVFALVTGESAVSILPSYFGESAPAGVVLAPVSDPWATWDFLVLRQRGQSFGAARDLVDRLEKLAQTQA